MAITLFYVSYNDDDIRAFSIVKPIETYLEQVILMNVLFKSSHFPVSNTW